MIRPGGGIEPGETWTDAMSGEVWRGVRSDRFSGQLKACGRALGETRNAAGSTGCRALGVVGLTGMSWSPGEASEVINALGDPPVAGGKSALEGSR